MLAMHGRPGGLAQGVAGRLIPLSQVHRLMTDRPRLRCAHRPDEIRWLSCDGVAVA